MSTVMVLAGPYGTPALPLHPDDRLPATWHVERAWQHDGRRGAWAVRDNGYSIEAQLVYDATANRRPPNVLAKLCSMAAEGRFPLADATHPAPPRPKPPTPPPSVYDEIDLDCPMAAYNALHRNGIRTYAELLALSDHELLRMRNMGPVRLADLKAWLAEIGLVGSDGQPVPTPHDLERADWLGQQITGMAHREPATYPPHRRRRMAAHRALAMVAGYTAADPLNDSGMLPGTLELHLEGLNAYAARVLEQQEGSD